MTAWEDLHCGHAPSDGAPFNGWFIGDLAAWAGDTACPRARTIQGLEIKWAEHRGGETRDGGWASRIPAHSVCILLEGSLTFKFRLPSDPRDIREHRLTRPGDYSRWGPDVEHLWTAPEDCRCITIRLRT